jgi:hypothetical protein
MSAEPPVNGQDTPIFIVSPAVAQRLKLARTKVATIERWWRMMFDLCIFIVSLHEKSAADGDVVRQPEQYHSFPMMQIVTDTSINKRRFAERAALAPYNQGLALAP